MLPSLTCLLTLAVGHAPAAPAASPLRPVRLTCEYLTNPLGIDTLRPRLTWTIESSRPERRGARQSAYRILVAASSAALSAGKGDLWDSGIVRSNRSAFVPYAGRPLTSRRQAYWKVRIWDEAGRPSAWSAPAKWSMGLLKRDHWAADWIGPGPMPAGPGRNAPLLRRTFDLPAKPVRAEMTVGSLGFHELWINGRRVGDAVLSPSISEMGKRVRAVTYDVAAYLHAGRNTVGLWIASGWGGFNRFRQPHHPLVIARLDAWTTKGKTTLVTDAAWQCRASGVWAIGRFPTHGGERVETPDAPPGWCAEATEAAPDWAPVQVHDLRVTLSAEMIEPNLQVRLIRPVAVEACPGGWRIDMGVNFSGWLSIGLHGAPGGLATITVSERPADEVTYGQKNEAVIGPDGSGLFRNRFNYVAGRWITVKGIDRAPEQEDIHGWLVRTSYKRASGFRCSDELLNRIYDTTLHTFESLSISGYTVDCPHRERMGYGGDAHATMETALRNYGMGAFYTKWLQDWRDVQQPDGDLPYTAPTYNGGGGPAWSGICVTLPWALYRATGDTGALAANFPTMRRWLAFLESHTRANLLEKWGGAWDFLGDWVPPGRDQGANRVDDLSTLMFNNCYHVYTLRIAARIAALLGHAADARKYGARADACAAAIHARFYRPEERSYAAGGQLNLALPLLTGVTPASLRPGVEANLVREIETVKRGHIDTGIHGTYFLIQQLLAMGRDDLVCLMTRQTDYPSWGYMLKQGATTIWEQWDGVHSLLHSSFLSIGQWFMEGVAGIRPDPSRPGYAAFIVKPGVTEQLEWAQGWYASIRGRIEVKWRRIGAGLRMEVLVPPNTEATICIPAAVGTAITESGVAAGKSPGVRRLGRQGAFETFRVGSGRYSFHAAKVRQPQRVARELLTVDSPGAHADRIEPFSRCDVQGAAIPSAEAHVGGPPLIRHGNALDLFAGMVEDDNAGSGQVHVASVVYRHAVGTHLAEEAFVLQRSICRNVVGIRSTCPDVGNVERLAVGGPDDAVRLLQVVCDARDPLAVRRQPKHRLRIALGHTGLPVGTPIERVGEVRRVVGRDPDIVGTIEPPSLLVARCRNSVFACPYINDPQLILLVGADPEATGTIEAHAVSPSRRLHERLELSVNGPNQDAIIGLIGEVDVSPRVARRSLGKGEAIGELRQFRPVLCDSS